MRGPPEIQYVNQRSDWDCGIACLAMVSGRAYERILTNFDGMNIEGVGIAAPLFDWWFRKHGFAVQIITEEADPDWPPRPWAPVHIASVQATRGSHVCVMDCLGRVFDPWDITRRTLTHRDYRSVRGVFGIWDISELSAAHQTWMGAR